MLAADKLQLQSALKQQATALKEKEFNLHHSNLMTVGTQAAVLAGLDITMFIEFNPPRDSEWAEEHIWIAKLLKMTYYGMIVGAFGLNILVVAHTTALSVLGASVALRGPDGSMMTATEGLYEERKAVFRAFGMGLALTIFSVLFGVWLILHVEAALFCWIVTLAICRQIYVNWKRVLRRFEYDENDTVDFSDLLNIPSIRNMIPSSVRRQNNTKNNRNTVKHNNTSNATNKGWSKRSHSDDILYHHDQDSDDDDDDNDDNGDVEQQTRKTLLSSPNDVKRRSSSRR